MNKYCTQCGTILKEDQPCSCKMNQPLSPAVTPSNQAISAILALFKSIPKAPADGIETYIRSDNYLSGIGLFALQLIANIFYSLFSITFFFGFDSVANYLSDYFYLFLVVTFGTLLLTAFFLGSLFVGITVLGGRIDIKKTVMIGSLRSVALIPFTLFAIPISLVNPALGFLFFFLGEFFALVFVCRGTKVATDFDPNKLMLFLPLVFVGVLIAWGFSLYISTFTFDINNSIDSIRLYFFHFGIGTP